MERRNFIKMATAGSIGAFALPWGPGRLKRNNRDKEKAQMKVGTQHFSDPKSKKDMEYLARYGVFHIDGGSPKTIEGEGWDMDDARAQQEAAGEYGISIDAYHLPLGSGGITNERYPHIMLGESPKRDREIDIIKQMIEVAGKVGVPNLLYNTTILPIVRSGETKDPDRGNTLYHTWNYEKAVREGKNKEQTIAGAVDIDELYERITYLLDRILPVAEEYGVRLGNHFADPPLPVGYRGITRWNSPDIFAGIKRYAKLYDSDSHGFNLALGVTAEGLTGSNEEKTNQMCDIIRWVGQRDQIFNVHMRNVKGGYNDFMEVYPDNGDIDFVRVVRALRDVGYDGMVMPDHLPERDNPEINRIQYAFAYGYNKALIQAAYEDV